MGQSLDHHGPIRDLFVYRFRIVGAVSSRRYPGCVCDWGFDFGDGDDCPWACTFAGRVLESEGSVMMDYKNGVVMLGFGESMGRCEEHVSFWIGLALASAEGTSWSLPSKSMGQKS